MDGELCQGSDEPGVTVATRDEGDSDAESFVDAVEELLSQEELPVTFERVSTEENQNVNSAGELGDKSTPQHAELNTAESVAKATEELTEPDTRTKNCLGDPSDNPDHRTQSSTVVPPVSEQKDCRSSVRARTHFESTSSSCSSDPEQDTAAVNEASVDDLIDKALKQDPVTTETGSEEPLDVIDEEEEARKQKEDEMSPEEKQSLRDEAQSMKAEGNDRFKAENYQGALESYTEALMTCPLCFAKERSIMYSNRGATKYKLENFEGSIEDCSKALELNPNYLKALLRRAELYEKTDKFEDALTDYQKALEMDPSLAQARRACMVLPEQIKERNEKMKAEMFGKLKDLGNLVLRPFGLSTDNFKLQQDPNSGSYSVNFQQKPTNGK